jgi:hypothetical protein
MFPLSEDLPTMRRFKTILAGLLAAPLLSLVVGCGEEAGVKQETKTTTPGGETKVTRETKVETQGDNPPPAADTTK